LPGWLGLAWDSGPVPVEQRQLAPPHGGAIKCCNLATRSPVHMLADLRRSLARYRDGGPRATPAGRWPEHDQGRVHRAHVLLTRGGAACSRGIRSRRKAPYPSARRLISFWRPACSGWARGRARRRRQPGEGEGLQLRHAPDEPRRSLRRAHRLGEPRSGRGKNGDLRSLATVQKLLRAQWRCSGS